MRIGDHGPPGSSRIPAARSLNESFIHRHRSAPRRRSALIRPSGFIRSKEFQIPKIHFAFGRDKLLRRRTNRRARARSVIFPRAARRKGNSRNEGNSLKFLVESKKLRAEAEFPVNFLDSIIQSNIGRLMKVKHFGSFPHPRGNFFGFPPEEGRRESFSRLVAINGLWKHASRVEANF